jgi:alpha-L-rhamnosidase
MAGTVDLDRCGTVAVGRAMFRKAVVLEERPRVVKAWLTADSKYFLYVNGRMVSRGPVDQGRDFAGGSTQKWLYDYRDLTPYFLAGINVISAEVFQRWPIEYTVSRGQPGFPFEAEITDDDKRKTTVASDTNWRSSPARQFVDETDCDLRKQTDGWHLHTFDDSSWLLSQQVKDIWEPLVASEIPPLMEARYSAQRIDGLPASRTFTTDGSVNVVFDRVC